MMKSLFFALAKRAGWYGSGRGSSQHHHDHHDHHHHDHHSRPLPTTTQITLRARAATATQHAQDINGTTDCTQTTVRQGTAAAQRMATGRLLPLEKTIAVP
jgi:hypothetical protein